VQSKPLCPRATIPICSLWLLLACSWAAGGLVGAEPVLSSRFVGAPGCASSSCHGGAGEKRSQWVSWNAADVHRRANTTLSARRSVQIAEAAKLGDPAASPRCTVCHAPFADVPATLRVNALDRTDGVSCETCHGPAEPYLRSHWRPDFTRVDRTLAGLRDLSNLYVRANTCVACHQNVDFDLQLAGHPELIFELDGQTRSEPRHWKEAKDFSGAQAWFVGQAVALREMAWQSGKTDQKAHPNVGRRDLEVGWLVRKAAKAAGFDGEDPDALAKLAAATRWKPAATAAILKALASSAGEFRANPAKSGRPEIRAERLVLALDRLLAASPPETEKKVETELADLFRRAQSRSDFSPADFSAALEKLAAKLD